MLIPEAVIDDVLFDPCGYSMNGLIKDVSSLFCFAGKGKKHVTGIF